MNLSFTTLTSEQNDSYCTTGVYGATSEIPIDTDDDVDLNTVRVFNVLNYIIGSTGVVMNLFVIVVIIGFVEAKAKVRYI
jgi:hypothetical protein